MSKHEPKVSKRKYITNMIIAIIISLLCGIALGYYTPKYIATKTVTTPQPVVQITPTPIAEPVKEELQLTKEEQSASVKDTLKGYYGINNAVLTKTVNESLTESKTGSKTQEEIFKEKLYKYYENIAAKDFLNTLKTFIYNGSLKATYYGDFFKAQEGSQVKKIEITDYKDKVIKAKVIITVPYKYYDKGTDIYPTLEKFFSEEKGTGITENGYKKLLALKPVKVGVLQTYNGTVTIENINNKWYITDYDYNIASTEIVDATIKEKAGEKTYTFSDLVKKYMSK